MNYITSVTSDSNNTFSMGSVGTESSRLSATSPFAQLGGSIPFTDSATSPFATARAGNFNDSATSPFATVQAGGYSGNDSATSPFATVQAGGYYGNGSATSAAASHQGGFWPFSSNDSHGNAKLVFEALRENNIHAAIFLIQKVGCLEKVNGQTILHHVVHNYNRINGAKTIVDAILKRNDARQFIDIQEDGTGDTALHIAAKNGNQELCYQLVHAGANTSLKNKDGLFVGSESESSPTRSHPVRSARNNANGIDYINCDSISPAEPNENDIKQLMKMFLNTNKTARQQMSDASHMPNSLGLSQNSSSLRQTVVDPYEVRHSVVDPYQAGGSLLDTEQFVNELLSKYENIGNANSQTGGRSGVVIGTRIMNTLSEYELSGGADSDESDGELSRLISRQSQDIHDRTVQKIMELMKVDEKVARNYKAALYQRVKSEHPELNNLDRAVEMEKLATKSILKGIDIDQVTKEIEAHIAAKKSESNSESDSGKEKASVRAKKPRKALSATSPASVPSESAFSLTSELSD